jgi:hypothetical protein
MLLFLAGIAIGILGFVVFQSPAVRDALNLLLIAVRPKPDREYSEVIAEKPKAKSAGASIGR